MLNNRTLGLPNLQLHCSTCKSMSKMVDIKLDDVMRRQWASPVLQAIAWTTIIVALSFVVAVRIFSTPEKPEILKKKRLPPSPKGWPLVGHLNVFLNKNKPLLYVIDDLCNSYGPIVMLKVGVQNVVFVNDPAMAMEFLKDKDHLFANRPRLPVMNYLLYGEDHLTLSHVGEHHNVLRKLIVTELLSGKQLQYYQKLRMEEQDLLFSEAFKSSLRRESIDMRELLDSLTLNVATRMGFSKKFFGPDLEERDKVRGHQWSHIIPEMTTRFGQILAETVHPSLRWVDTLTGVRKGMQGCFRRLDGMLQELLDEHRQKLSKMTEQELENYEAQDFMDTMLLMSRGEFAKHFDDKKIKSNALDLIVAGSETSATILEWAMAELLINPGVMKRLQEEVDLVVGLDRVVEESDVSNMPLLIAVVKEAFRLHPPLPWLLPHASRVDVKVGNYDIPAESSINFNVYGMSRSALFWDNPHSFDPDRFLRDSSIDTKGAHPQLLPFGAGRRGCPGIGMTNLIVQSTLARLVHSFDWSIPVNGEGVGHLDMTPRSGAIASKLNPLVIDATPRLGLHLLSSK